MDEELKQLEEELRVLQPRRISTVTRERVETALAKPSRGAQRQAKRATILPWAGALLAVAAAVALMLRVDETPSRASHDAKTAALATAPANAAPTRNEESASAAPNVFRPVAARNVLLESRDEGLVVLDDGTRARRLRQRYLDTVTWKNPRTNALVEWTVPREDVRLTPVAWQ